VAMQMNESKLSTAWRAWTCKPAGEEVEEPVREPPPGGAARILPAPALALPLTPTTRLGRGDERWSGSPLVAFAPAPPWRAPPGQPPASAPAACRKSTPERGSRRSSSSRGRRPRQRRFPDGRTRSRGHGWFVLVSVPSNPQLSGGGDPRGVGRGDGDRRGVGLGCDTGAGGGGGAAAGGAG